MASLVATAALHCTAIGSTIERMSRKKKPRRPKHRPLSQRNAPAPSLAEPMLELTDDPVRWALLELEATYPTATEALSRELWESISVECRARLEAEDGPGACEKCRARWLTSELLLSIAEAGPAEADPPSHGEQSVSA